MWFAIIAIVAVFYLTMGGFGKRSFFRFTTLIGVFFVSGIMTNWQALSSWKDTGAQQAVWNVFTAGGRSVFLDIPKGVSHIMLGGFDIVVGAFMLMFSIVTIFVFADWAMDVATGLDTPGHPIWAFLVAVVVVLVIGLVGNAINPVDLVDSGSNFSNNTTSSCLISGGECRTECSSGELSSGQGDCALGELCCFVSQTGGSDGAEVII